MDRLVVKNTPNAGGEGGDGGSASLAKRLADSMETAVKWGKGQVVVDVVGGEALEFTESFAASDSAFNFEDIEPRLFSFNSPYGACPDCHGLGIKTEFDPDLIVPDKSKSIENGAILPYVAATSGQTNEWALGLFRGVAERFHFSSEKPIEQLSQEQYQALMHGVKGSVTVTFRNKWGRNRQFTSDYAGVVGMLQKKLNETESDNIKEWLAQFQADKPCPTCKGKRLKPEALAVLLGGINVSDLCALSIEKAHGWFDGLKLTNRQQIIGRQIVREIQTRLGFLLNVGLGYLTLDRAAATLAGGEAQRIRLASQIGSGLTGVLYILDEPSIGLHQRDNTRLIETLMRLRGLGNTIIVVEHDEETMAAADWIVDIGPGAGEHGGRIVAQGTPGEIMANPGQRHGPLPVGPGQDRGARRASAPPTASRWTSRARAATISAAWTCAFPWAASSVSPGCRGPASPPLFRKRFFQNSKPSSISTITPSSRWTRSTASNTWTRSWTLTSRPSGAPRARTRRRTRACST